MVMNFPPSACAARAISSTEAFPSDQVVWQCTKPWMSRCWISSGSVDFPASSISPQSSRISGGTGASPRMRYSSSSSRTSGAGPCDGSSRARPYSEMERPLARAMPRSLTWCCLLPVKWWNALANWDSVTTRRSACRPSRSLIEHLVGPRASTSIASEVSANRSITGAGSGAAATRSTSALVSLYRRTLPAISARVTPGAERTRASSFSATRRVSYSGWRACAAWSASMPWRICCSVFSPNPLRPRTRCSRQARSRSARLPTSSSLMRIAALRGPKPGMRIRSSAPSGNSLRNSSR